MALAELRRLGGYPMTESAITHFRGEYRFLSNFWPQSFIVDRITYPSVEHAFQSMKTWDEVAARKIREARSPGEAKSLGRSVPLRHDWDEIKLGVMHTFVQAKFAQNADLEGKLLATWPATLEEGNTWGDRYWGVDGWGENWLGRILMLVRSQAQWRG